KSTERLVDRGTLVSEKLRAFVSDVQTVFKSNSELAIDDDGGFIAKAHAGLNRGLVTTHEVGPLVAIQTDAVSGAMRQTRNFVVRPEARICDYFTRSRIDCFAWRADLSSRKAGVLRFAFKIPNVALSLGRFAENKCARDVRLITLDTAPAIHQHHVALLERLWRA